MKYVILALMFAMAAMPAASQIPAQKPAFEVVSIKPSAIGISPPSMETTGAMFRATNATLHNLLVYAYLSRKSMLQNDQMIGGPEWIDGPDRFDVQAKFSGDVHPEQVSLMIQTMLEDRFRMKAHFETRELATYNLVIAKDGLKMKGSANQNLPDLNGEPPLILDKSKPLTRGTIKLVPESSPSRRLTMTLSGSAVSLDKLTSMLQGYTDRRVIDKTGLKGLYDFELQFAPELRLPGGGLPPPQPQNAASDPSGPLLADALQHQLGLKLESAKGPVEVLVIDSVSKPSEN